MAGEKNPLSQLRHSQDRATFGIPFVMESGVPKTLLPFEHDKELCMYKILDGIKLDLTLLTQNESETVLQITLFFHHFTKHSYGYLASLIYCDQIFFEF